MKYVHYYETVSAFTESYDGENYLEPWLSYTDETQAVNYNKYDPSNGHCYVDLGLPSGTKWACTNIGAENQEDLGGAYMWGETEPYVEGWTYKFGSYPFTKYNSTDGKASLDLEDDVANVEWGGDWHVPTLEQVYELMENTTRTESGDCVVFTSNINGSQITLPIYNGYSRGLLIWINECSIDPSFHPSSAWMLVWGCESAYEPYLNNETNTWRIRCWPDN